MPIILSSEVDHRVFEFAVAVASAARIFVIPQIARHQDLSWRTQPERRAREFLNHHAESFERMNGPFREPQRWRLSKLERRRRNIKQKAVNGVSQKAPHWLGIGDIWISLTFDSGRPTRWFLEPDNQFDIYCEWCGGIPYLIEYQRTPITERQWAAKFHKREVWYKKQGWGVKPTKVLVNITGQQDKTIKCPADWKHVRSVDVLPRKIRKPPQ